MKSRSREINIFSVSALDLFASALGAFILISIVLMPYFLRVSQEEVDQLRSALTQAQAALAETRQQLRQAQGELQQCLQREAACRQEVDGLQRQVDQLQGELAQAESELAQARSELAQAQDSQSALQRCQAELDACEKKLAKTFLAVVIQWETERHDVDLHIIDPAGNEFQYNAPKHPPQPGELSADTTCGPGVEIWEVAQAPPGEYRILYNFFSRRGNSCDSSRPANQGDAIVKGGVYYRDGHVKLRERRLTGVGRSNALTVAIVTVNDDGSVDIDDR